MHSCIVQYELLVSIAIALLHIVIDQWHTGVVYPEDPGEGALQQALLQVHKVLASNQGE